MLQRIRERVQGWIASTIIGLIVLTFALWGIESYLGSGSKGDEVAKVNGETITNSDLQSGYERLKQNLTLPALNALAADPDVQATLKKTALNQLILQKVLADAAIKEGFRITEEQLRAVIMQLPAFQMRGSFSPTQYEQALSASGYSEQQFLFNLQTILLTEQIQKGIIKSAFALLNEVNDEVLLANQTRDIRFAIVPAKQFFSQIKITSDDINAYYQQHESSFKTPEKVSIEYLLLSPETITPSVHVSSQEIQQYYQDNVDTYKKNGKVIPIAHVKNEIAKGLAQEKAQQIFSQQSQQLSELTYTHPDTLTPAANALGLTTKSTDYFTRTGGNTDLTKVPAILAATFSDDVLKNGNNSAMLTLPDGSAIVLRVKDYRPAAVEPLSQVSSTIQKLLSQLAAQAAAKEWASKILAHQENVYPMQWQTEKAVKRTQSSINPQILETAYTLPPPIGNNPSIKGVQLSNGDYAMVALSAIHQDKIPNLQLQTSVYQQLLADSYGKLEYQWYTDYQMKKAKIKIS